MKDSVFHGFIGGVLGAIVMNLIDWTMYLIGFNKERLLDWASIVVLGRLQSGTGELIFAQIAQVFFSGFIGILFFTLLDNKNQVMFKGWVFSVLVWFFIYGLAIGFELPHLKDRTLFAGISHFISASAFGLILSYYRNRVMMWAS